MSVAALDARSPRVDSADARLARRAGAGNELAFELIVARYRGALVRYAERIVGQSHADDAVQQALVSAWRSLRGGCQVRDLRAWLFTIVHRSALEILRADRGPRCELPAALAAARSADEHAELAGSTHAMLAALARLPDSEREALISTSVHGRSGRDAARALGVSESALRQLVFRARTRLRAAADAPLSVLPTPGLLGALRRLLGRSVALARRAGATIPAPGLGAGKLAVVLTLSGAAATPMLLERASPPARPSHASSAAAVPAADATRARTPIAGAARTPASPTGLAPARARTADGGAAPGSRGEAAAPWRAGQPSAAGAPNPLAERRTQAARRSAGSPDATPASNLAGAVARARAPVPALWRATGHPVAAARSTLTNVSSAAQPLADPLVEAGAAVAAATQPGLSPPVGGVPGAGQVVGQAGRAATEALAQLP